ncbi:RNA polymerase sigma factor [Geothrix fuzhouensis]|uniref:RNA polymerase sigma factor n=1 Tax=Geothrix fuzhouensis TaxID=2966451 RepID=UPI002148708C|nr:RNA polymerase sigma factor [Geothrix fuzhouensis]
MAQVREGRVERLALVFERHHLHLFNFFLRLTGQRGLSEDLVQDVFLRLLRYRSSYRPGAPFAPWMWQIARNVHRDHLQTLRAHLPLEGLQERIPDDLDGAEIHLMRGQDAARLKWALERLDPTKRELLLLSRNPDLAYKDLAGLMACSVGNVKVQVHRALKELRAVFMDLQGGLS